MVRQPEYGSRNVTDSFYLSEMYQIGKINAVLDGVELTSAEEKTMLWLAGWEDSTVNNILSVIEKAARVKGRELLGKTDGDSRGVYAEHSCR